MGAHAGIAAFNGLNPIESESAVLKQAITRGVGVAETVYQDAHAFMTIASAPGDTSFFCGKNHAVTFEGRLDERESLVARLRSADESISRDAPAAEIVGAAYRRWGTGALGMLVGDWSLAIWDSDARRLVLAVDFPGLSRPMYVRKSGARVVWSSELSMLVKIDSAVTVSREYVLSFIVGRPDVEQTPYRDILAVPPGHAIVYSETGVQRLTAWRPDFGARIVYKEDESYREHFRELFWKVIKDRLDGPQGVWAELSGGIDSSSIVAVASRVLGEKRSGFAAVSYRFEFNGTLFCEDDEQHRSDLLATVPVPCHVIDCEHHSLRFSEDPMRPMVATPLIVHERARQVASRMAAAGVSVLISGEGGDTALCSNTLDHPYMADLFITGRWRKLAEAIRQIGTLYRRPYLKVLQRNVYQRIVPSRDRHSLDFLRARNDWINWAEVYRAIKMGNSLSGAGGGRLLPSQKYTRDSISSIIAGLRAQSFRHVSPISITYPYLDRRMIEFIAAIPFNQRISPQANRLLQRRGLEAFLPQSIAQRRTKPSLDGAFVWWLNRQWADMSDLIGPESRIAQLGFVDPVLFYKAAERIRAGVSGHVVAFWRALSAESWLRHAEKHGLGI